MLKENEVQEQGIQALKEYLSVIPSLSIESIDRLNGDIDPDFRVRVRCENREQILYAEMKSQGTPKITRTAVNALLLYKPEDPSAYKIFIAPFISSGSAKICDSAGVGYLDLSGNCKIQFQQVFISRENCPNRYPVKTNLSSLSSPKSARILRVLLTFPEQPWKTLPLAEAAQVSPGMITHVRKKLEEEEWITTAAEGFSLIKPEALLQDWTMNYSLQKNTRFDFYTLKPLGEIEGQLAEICSELNISYALTGFSAANRLAPMVRGQRSMAYVSQSIDLVADKLGLKPVNSGANVSLYLPYDEGVLWNAQVIDDIKIATPIQVYLDLKNLPGRGEEAADFLYKKVIEKSWQSQKTNTTSA